jgi:hypothetical protein
MIRENARLFFFYERRRIWAAMKILAEVVKGLSGVHLWHFKVSKRLSSYHFWYCHYFSPPGFEVWTWDRKDETDILSYFRNHFAKWIFQKMVKVSYTFFPQKWTNFSICFLLAEIRPNCQNNQIRSLNEFDCYDFVIVTTLTKLCFCPTLMHMFYLEKSLLVDS